MENSYLDSIGLLISTSAVCSLVLIAGVVLHYKSLTQNSKTSHLGSILMFLEVFGMLKLILDIINHGAGIDTPAQHEILQTWFLTAGYVVYVFLLVYILELKRPGWFTPKKAVVCILPIMSLAAYLIATDPGHTPLYSLSGVMYNIRKPDVYLRILMLSIYFISSVAVACVPHSWKEAAISPTMLAILETLTILLSINLFLGLGLNYETHLFLFIILLVSVNILICHIELAIKLPAKRKIKIEKNLPAMPSGENHPFFDNPEIWMNPEMTALKLCKLMGTNQKYLSEQIKARGYAGYSDMINRKRVNYICEKLSERKNTHGDIVQLMFESGFRSRSNASSEFKRITGMTPSEYLKSKEKF